MLKHKSILKQYKLPVKNKKEVNSVPWMDRNKKFEELENNILLILNNKNKNNQLLARDLTNMISDNYYLAKF